MKPPYINKFNSVYGSSECYYGLELRNEFTDYFKEKDLTNQCALDLGCGEGRYSLFLAKHGCHVTAIDRSSVGVQKLAKICKKDRLLITPETIDVDDFIFPENYFDIIIAATILDHLEDKLRKKISLNIKKALKPSGILYANVFTRSDPGYNVKQNGSPGPVSSDVSDTAECMEYYFDHEELKFLFKGLDTIHYYEGVEPDLSHGQPHHHGWACLLAQKSV